MFEIDVQSDLKQLSEKIDNKYIKVMGETKNIFSAIKVVTILKITKNQKKECKVTKCYCCCNWSFSDETFFSMMYKMGRHLNTKLNRGLF